MAYQLAELNCKLIITARSEEKLQEVKVECIKRSENKLTEDCILIEPFDLANFNDCEAAFNRIIRKYRNVDLIVLNSARGYVAGAADDDFESIQKMWAINYFSHLFIGKLLLQHWLASPTPKGQCKGKILATSAVAATLDIFPYASQYSAAKKVLNCFLRDVAMQHQKNGIFVTNCFPGRKNKQFIRGEFLWRRNNFGFISITGPVETAFDKNLIKPKRTTKHPEFKKQSVQRVAHLMLVSLANSLAETWICFNPYLLLSYFSHGSPNYLMFWIIKHLNLAR